MRARSVQLSPSLYHVPSTKFTPIPYPLDLDTHIPAYIPTITSLHPYKQTLTTPHTYKAHPPLPHTLTSKAATVQLLACPSSRDATSGTSDH